MRGGLYKTRVRRLEDAVLELIEQSAKTPPATVNDQRQRVRSLMAASREYAAALKSLAKGT